jgi:hypothetical protein
VAVLSAHRVIITTIRGAAECPHTTDTATVRPAPARVVLDAAAKAPPSVASIVTHCGFSNSDQEQNTQLVVFNRKIGVYLMPTFGIIICLLYADLTRSVRNGNCTTPRTELPQTRQMDPQRLQNVPAFLWNDRPRNG